MFTNFTNCILDSYELLVESPDTVVGSRFTVAYHFENAVKAAGERCHPNRMKRLAQEVATLTISLPLSLSSSVFVRCDTDRLDIMKVNRFLVLMIDSKSLFLIV